MPRSDWPDYYGYLQGVVVPVEVIDLPNYPFKRARATVTLDGGGTSTIIDTGTGKRGWLIYMAIRADGVTTDAMGSGFKVWVDDSLLGDFTIVQLATLWSGASPPLNTGALGLVVRDDAAFNYSGWWLLRVRFTDSLKVQIFNGDAANATQIIYEVYYESK